MFFNARSQLYSSLNLHRRSLIILQLRWSDRPHNTIIPPQNKNILV
ncbi:hypothetical protein [Nostoc sp.]